MRTDVFAISIAAVAGLGMSAAYAEEDAKPREGMVGPLPYSTIAEAIRMDQWIDKADASFSSITPIVQVRRAANADGEAVNVDDVVLYLDQNDAAYAVDAYGYVQFPISRALLEDDARLYMTPDNLRSVSFGFLMTVETDRGDGISLERHVATTAEYQKFRERFNPLIRRLVPAHEGYTLLLSQDGVCHYGEADDTATPMRRWEFDLKEMSETSIICTANVDHVVLSVTD
jgi:hypothetical protein